jgi:MFS family permease
MGWIVGAYGFVWGGSQLFTGRLSDHVGRFWPNVLGMWICGAGVLMVVLGDGAAWWSLSAGIAGFGMALLYPNLGASVADITPPAWRGSAIGIYRFWRDLGYGIGALGLGLVAHLTGAVEAAFWFVALSMFASGLLLFFWGEETHPRLNPVSEPEKPLRDTAATRLGWSAVLLGLASILLLAVSAYGYRQDWWPVLRALDVATWGAWAAIAGAAPALAGLGLWLARRRNGGGVAALGLALSLPVLISACA